MRANIIGKLFFFSQYNLLVPIHRVKWEMGGWGAKRGEEVGLVSCPAIMIRWASCTKRAMNLSEPRSSL